MIEIPKLYKLIEEVLIQEYGEEYVSEYSVGTGGIHFYDETLHKDLVLKIEEE